MAKTTRKRNLTVDQVKELIQNNRNIVTISDILIELKASKQTFYYYFPYDSDGLNEIKETLEGNKTKIKKVIRDKLLNCNSPAALIALYKLMGTQEEREALNAVAKPKEENKEDKEIELVIE